MTDFYTALREHVRELIDDRGLSQNAFAEALGRSQSSVSQLLTGNRHRKDFDAWKAMAAYFDRTLSQLVAEAEQRQLTTPDTAPDPRPAAQSLADARLLLQHDIEILVRTEWRKRNHAKLQRLFESIADRIEGIMRLRVL